MRRCVLREIVAGIVPRLRGLKDNTYANNLVFGGSVAGIVPRLRGLKVYCYLLLFSISMPLQG